MAPHIDLFVIVPLLFWLFNATRNPQTHRSGARTWRTHQADHPAWRTGVDAALSRRNILVGSLRSACFYVLFDASHHGIQAPLGLIWYFFKAGILAHYWTRSFWDDRPTQVDSHHALFLSAPLDYHQPKQEPLFYRFGDALCIALACSPVVFPWYLLILTPWIVRREFPIVGWWSASLLTTKYSISSILIRLGVLLHGRIKSQSLFLSCGRCLDEQTRSC